MALAVLPPLITATAAALGMWIAERRKDRDEVQRRLKAIGEESARLGYLRAWLQTQQLAVGGTGINIDAVREEVCQDLMTSRVRLGNALQDRADPESPSPLLRVWRNAAMIPLYRPAARAIRWCYWFCVLIGALWMMLIFSMDYSDIGGYGFGTVAFVALLLFLPFGAVALGLRAWARALEKGGVRSRDPRPAGMSRKQDPGPAGYARTGGWIRKKSPPTGASPTAFP